MIGRRVKEKTSLEGLRGAGERILLVNEIAATLDLESLAPQPATPAAGASPEGGPNSDAEVLGAQASDLLSDVLANAPAGGILLTIQVLMNAITVALHAGLTAVVLTSGMKPDEAVRARAAEGGIPLFATAEGSRWRIRRTARRGDVI